MAPVRLERLFSLAIAVGWRLVEGGYRGSGLDGGGFIRVIFMPAKKLAEKCGVLERLLLLGDGGRYNLGGFVWRVGIG